MLRLRKLWLRPKKSEIEPMPHPIANYHAAIAIGKCNRDWFASAFSSPVLIPTNRRFAVALPIRP